MINARAFSVWEEAFALQWDILIGCVVIILYDVQKCIVLWLNRNKWFNFDIPLIIRSKKSSSNNREPPKAIVPKNFVATQIVILFNLQTSAREDMMEHTWSLYCFMWFKLNLTRTHSTDLTTYIHKLTTFSHGGRQKPQNATCYDPYILLSPRPRSYIWSYKRAGYEYCAPDLSEESHQ